MSSAACGSARYTIRPAEPTLSRPTGPSLGVGGRLPRRPSTGNIGSPSGRNTRAAKALWMLVLITVALASISLGVIKREEQHLERKFGDEYGRYKAKVRRWL